jgi:hypothetical protein
MTPEEYRARAADCDRIANSQHDPDMRDRWLALAQQWRALAVQLEEINSGALDPAATRKPHEPKTGKPHKPKL